MPYPIGKVRKSCAECGREFQNGEKRFSYIMESEDGELMRRDLCGRCWQSQKPGYLSYWVKQVEYPPVRRFDRAVAVRLFQRLYGTETAQNKPYLYILALLLMRKRVLKFEKATAVAGRKFLLFYFRKDEERFSVEEPQLSEEELEKIKQQLGELMETEIEC